MWPFKKSPDPELQKVPEPDDMKRASTLSIEQLQIELEKIKKEVACGVEERVHDILGAVRMHLERVAQVAPLTLPQLGALADHVFVGRLHEPRAGGGVRLYGGVNANSVDVIASADRSYIAFDRLTLGCATGGTMRRFPPETDYVVVVALIPTEKLDKETRQ